MRYSILSLHHLHFTHTELETAKEMGVNRNISTVFNTHIREVLPELFPTDLQ